MIWLILALAAEPQTAPTVEAETPRPFALPYGDQSSPPARRAAGYSADAAVVCENTRLQKAMGPAVEEAASQQWFSDGAGRIYAAPVGQVRLYSAMVLSVGGCSMPIVALNRVPAADRSRGRVFGQTLRD